MSQEAKRRVRERYSAVARSSRIGGCDLTGGAYANVEGLSEGASLGCGNPVALAGLSAGEVVLDLGSGGGLDVLLSARRVSPGGKAYGLDMTDEMLELARKNQREAGVENAEFLKGEIEDVPLPDDSMDVVISNCVINLSADKQKALSEASRVLKAGGRLAVYDVVFLGSKRDLPEATLRSAELWAGCVSGALEKDEYERMLGDSGFTEVSVEPTHTYSPEEMAVSGCCGGSGTEALRQVPLASAFIRGRKAVA